MVIILLLASLNSCSNPWIYMAFSDVICHRISSKCRHHHRQSTVRESSFSKPATHQNGGYQNKSLLIEESSKESGERGEAKERGERGDIGMKQLHVGTTVSSRVKTTTSEWV